MENYFNLNEMTIYHFDTDFGSLMRGLMNLFDLIYENNNCTTIYIINVRILYTL